MLTMIKQVSVFIICAQMILHFKAEQKYGKYLKLLIGMMVLVQLFVPLMTLFGQSEESLSASINCYVERFTGNTTGTLNDRVPSEDDFTTLQIEEIKSIFNNTQNSGVVRETDGTVVSDQAEAVQVSGTGTTEEEKNAIIIERIEVKPDDG